MPENGSKWIWNPSFLIALEVICPGGRLRVALRDEEEIRERVERERGRCEMGKRRDICVHMRERERERKERKKER